MLTSPLRKTRHRFHPRLQLWKTFKRILFSRNFVSSTPYALVASPPTLLSATCFPGGRCLPSGRPPAWVLSGPSGATGQEGGEEPDAKPCSDLIEGRPDRWRRGAGEQRGFRSHGERQEGPRHLALRAAYGTPRPPAHLPESYCHNSLHLLTSHVKP